MKKSLLKSLLLTAIAACTTQLVYAGGTSTVTRTVYFYLQPGISDIYFIATNLNPTNLPTPQINYPTGQMTISVTTTVANAIDTSKDNFNNGHTLAFNAAIDTAETMDYIIGGTLYINGDNVGLLNLSENSGNWWAQNAAATYYAQGSLVGLNMAPLYSTKGGKRNYCLKQTSYNTVYVYLGTCDSI